jgi:hypothetical protein
MKKILPIFIIVAAMTITSCGSDETKADASDTQGTLDTLQKISTDTALSTPIEKPQKSGTTRSIEPDKSSGNHNKNEILANIDQYLVSKPAYPDPGNVVIENTLPDATVQKAIIEVTIFKENNIAVRIDYYIVYNIEPGDSKTVKIAGTASGRTASSHVVKLKSNELTAGETIDVGIRFVPK